MMDLRAKPDGPTADVLRRGVAVIACVLVITSCANDGSDARAVQDVGGAYELLAAAVDADDRGQARRILQDLIRSVEEFREDGEIDPARAGAILEAASEVSAALRTLPAPTVSPEPSPAATSGEAIDPGEGDGDEDEGHADDGGHGSGDGAPGNSGGKGNGKAHGHDKD